MDSVWPVITSVTQPDRDLRPFGAGFEPRAISQLLNSIHLRHEFFDFFGKRSIP